MSTAFWWDGRSFVTPADVADWQFATRGARDIDLLTLGGTPYLLIAESLADTAVTYFPRTAPSAIEVVKNSVLVSSFSFSVFSNVMQIAQNDERKFPAIL